jgi:hypothetical protein
MWAFGLSPLAALLLLLYWRRRQIRPVGGQSVSKPKQLIMNKETMFRVLVVGLLAATLVVQTLILCRLPPRATPIGVYVENGSLDVNVENRSLDVDVGNTVNVDFDTPVEVKIVR